MINRNYVARAIAQAFGGLAVCAIAPIAFAQQSSPTADTQKLERVEVTGSSIKRIQAEGALPVQVVTREDIERSGVQSVTDLVQRLPSMQGFVVSADSVNGGGGGVSTASLRSLGANYTLVLVNGKRMAPFNTGSAVNLQSIPLAAIERVEVLTDGASAIYGADAIAGVVNFILRKDSTEGSFQATYNRPEKSGGASYNVGLSKGFGDLERDRFNILASFSHDAQDELNATQRTFSKSGIQRVPGTNLALRLNSINSVPANVTLADAQGNFLAGFNPFLLQNNGQCPALHLAAGNNCRFDFASQVQLVPKSERNSLFLSGRAKLADTTQVYADFIASRFLNEPRYAPPAQPLPASFFPGGLAGPLYTTNVLPFLSQLGVNPATVDADNTTYSIRVFDAGGRQDRYTTTTLHGVFGVEGVVAGWDYNAGLTYSQNEFKQVALGGYLSANRFIAAIDAGAYNPFAPAGGAVAALAPAVLKEQIDKSKSTLTSLNVRASRAVFELAGGPVSVGSGIDVSRQGFVGSPSPILQGQNALQPNFTDTIIGGGGGALPFDSSRNILGLFAEIAVPVTKQLEVSGAVRYDRFSAVTNDRNFDASGAPAASATQGQESSRATYKLSARFQPSQQTLFRGSVGTGFRAPTMANITSPLASAGVTSREYSCPFPAGDPLAAGCSGAVTQYNVVSGGNPFTDSRALKPEKSRQWTVGMRIEPSPQFSAGIDLWSVKLKDQVSAIPESVAFGNGQQYRSLFALLPDPISGQIRTTFVSVPINLTRSEYAGADLDVQGRFKTGLGALTVRAATTYMDKASYEVPGLPGLQSSLGKYGPDETVVSRWLWNTSATLQRGAWTHTLAAQYRPGYVDSEATGCPAPDTCSGPDVRPVLTAAADGTPLTFGARVNIQRRVSEYFTFDWQSVWQYNKQLSFTVGVKNLLDRDPPFSIQDGGTGNMRGFDPRYADGLGRQFYATVGYKF